VPKSHERHTHQILNEIGEGRTLSQRSLARRLGIALGLTNLLVSRVIRKGWVRAVRVKPNRVRYLLTPTGIAEKTRMSRVYLQQSVRFYVDARERIRDSFTALSAQLPVPRDAVSAKRILFFGTNEVAEIGYVCLQETDLRLVGAIDDRGRDRFFDVPVHSVDDLTADGIDGVSFDCLVVMTFGDVEKIRETLDKIRFSEERMFWI
jgi:hypothetical protein